MASDAALRRITAQFPDWHTWLGVTGQLYARRPRSSPPKVVRGAHPGELADAIREAEHPAYWERACAARAAAAGELAQRREEQARFDGPLPGG
jgi:hypothetical protein